MHLQAAAIVAALAVSSGCSLLIDTDELTGGRDKLCDYDQTDVLALYTFDGELTADETGNHDAEVENAAPAVSPDAPTDCGGSAVFMRSWLVLEKHSDWQQIKSVDFWVKFTGAPDGTEGILSRDARNQVMGGHFTIRREMQSQMGIDNKISVSLQDMISGVAMLETVIPTGEWHHIGVNVGPPELVLFVNGERKQSFANGQTLAGNDNPFAIGASTDTSEEGQFGVNNPLDGAQLDHVRFSSVERAFPPVSAQ
jgi:hypothetical protein